MVSESSAQVAVPTWLRNTGFASWLLVGFVLVVVGLIWLLGETSTIVMPVLLAAVLGAVAGPAVGWLERHRIPRIGGALLVLLGLAAPLTSAGMHISNELRGRSNEPVVTEAAPAPSG